MSNMKDLPTKPINQLVNEAKIKIFDNYKGFIGRLDKYTLTTTPIKNTKFQIASSNNTFAWLSLASLDDSIPITLTDDIKLTKAEILELVKNKKLYEQSAKWAKIMRMEE